MTIREGDSILHKPTGESDVSRLRFSLRVRRVVYGDEKAFYETKVFAWLDGRAVGVWDGQTRIYKRMIDARHAGCDMVRDLRQHDLYVIDVTKKNIEEGNARSCQACAISQALWREQERMGFPRYQWDFRVEPYGSMVKCDGIILENKQSHAWGSTGEREMPDVVMQSSRGPYVESMLEWTMAWDEYADSRSMTLAEWRETFGREKGDTPYRPFPCSFVLDITAMKIESLVV